MTAEQKQQQLDYLNDKVNILIGTKNGYLSQKGKVIKGISIRTSTESVTLNTILENPIYDEVVSNFIDALVPKIDEEITLIQNDITIVTNTNTED